MFKKSILVSCLCFVLVASSASAAPLSVPSLKPLSSTRAWFEVGDYSSVLRGVPSASPEYLADARSYVHSLRHRLNQTVQRRDGHRRRAVYHQALRLRRQLSDDARANARGQRQKARDHFHERRREAKKIPDPQRRREKLRDARQLFTKRKLEIERSLLGNLREASRTAARAQVGRQATHPVVAPQRPRHRKGSKPRADLPAPRTPQPELAKLRFDPRRSSSAG